MEGLAPRWEEGNWVVAIYDGGCVFALLVSFSLSYLFFLLFVYLRERGGSCSA